MFRKKSRKEQWKKINKRAYYLSLGKIHVVRREGQGKMKNKNMFRYVIEIT